MRRKLILFDIDGTLVVTDTSSYDYWHEVVKKHYGLSIHRKDIYMEGKTDKQILKEFLQLKGIENPLLDERFDETLDDMAVLYSEGICARGKLKTTKILNAEKIITRLIDENHVVGLLTGNIREKARIKLQSVGLWQYFKVGAYGDASDKRSELVKIALRNAKEKFGVDFQRKDVFIVGDTVMDIQCAKEAGVKSVALATGSESFEMLKREKPDFIFKDFRNLEYFIEVFRS